MAIATKNKASKKAGKKASKKAGSKAGSKAGRSAAGKARSTTTPKQPARKTAANAKGTTTKVAPAKGTSAKQAAKAGKAKASEPERAAPTMAEVDADVLEFIAAIDAFKQQHGRPFPSWSEVLLIVRQLGYSR